MTVPSTARRAGPYTGNGSTTSFSFSFKTFAAGDLVVTRTASTGVETTLVLNSDYSVSLNVDQDASPGGTITYPISGSPLPAGYKLTIVGDLAYEQTTDLLGGGAFNARVIEDTFDRTVIQIQQLEERLDRAAVLPVSVTGVSVTLPDPEASKVLGWNVTETGLVNIDASSLASVTASAYVVVDKFTGDGSTTQFVCSQLPGSTNAAEVTIAGVMQNPAVDYTVSGARVVFTSPPPNGAVIIVRFLVAASQSSGAAFTTERHIATAGQSVFTLANAYAPGADTISVFINGVLMTSVIDYAETSANVVTFVTGLSLNDEVVFHIWRTTVLSTADSANVSYTPAGSGAVQRTVQSKLRDVVSVKDFGAVGDGVTDDTVAVQAAIDTVETLGGNLVFPPGKYLFSSQVTINRTYASSGGNFVGERNLIISGYGAEIRTTGAITAFDVRGGWLPNHNCLIEGFTIYHRGNTQAVGGIRMIGAGLVTCKEVSVVVSNSLPAGYAAFSLENVDPADPDTGCFWCLIDQCSVRPWSGAEGFVTYGVKAMGAANALTLRNNTFGGANTHVILMPHPGQTYSPNAVNIDGNFFEGPTAAIGIELNSAAPTYHVTGTRITNNRFEAINTAVTLTGSGTTVQLPTYMSGNYADTSVTNYVVNSLNIPLVMLDFAIVGAAMGPAKMHNQEGVVIEHDNGAYSPLTIKAIGFGKGLELRRQSGNVLLGTVGYSNAAGGIGMQLAGSYSPDYRPLTIKGCQGIAARDTAANNLAGTSNFSAATTVTVTLPIAETDANYLIFLEARANQKLWVSARTTTDFTVESDVSSSNAFGWLLIRHL